MDFSKIVNDYKLYTPEQSPALSLKKQYGYSKEVNNMIGEVLDIFGGYLGTDDATKFMYTMDKGLNNSKVVKSGKATSMSHIMQTFLTGEFIKMKGAMAPAINTPDSKQNDEKMKVIYMLGNGLMNLPLIERMSDKEREKLPSETKALFKKYRDLEEQLASQIAKYQPK